MKKGSSSSSVFSTGIGAASAAASKAAAAAEGAAKSAAPAQAPTPTAPVVKQPAPVVSSPSSKFPASFNTASAAASKAATAAKAAAKSVAETAGETYTVAGSELYALNEERRAAAEAETLPPGASMVDKLKGLDEERLAKAGRDIERFKLPIDEEYYPGGEKDVLEAAQRSMILVRCVLDFIFPRAPPPLPPPPKKWMAPLRSPFDPRPCSLFPPVAVSLGSECLI